MTTEEAIRILYEMLSKTFNGGGELGGLAVQMAVEALRKQDQMMKDAVERVVKVDAGGYPYIDDTELYDYTEDKPLAKAGDKVKIVVIKED